jgi:hypothetical protein
VRHGLAWASIEDKLTSGERRARLSATSSHDCILGLRIFTYFYTRGKRGEGKGEGNIEDAERVEDSGTERIDQLGSEVSLTDLFEREVATRRGRAK